MCTIAGRLHPSLDDFVAFYFVPIHHLCLDIVSIKLYRWDDWVVGSNVFVI